eukprot:CAMPEP_0119427346 /NCGR_PEP_ID=MMETSP1335-20130426/38111_1 /TAXON_ID=259385 /ORGANISM="Chrysoculter rhomboideus, Strain RCC1486" /LENGTH=74 /DNA_ID=CAMNT_0007452975 /DNA_START=29 /DNA_END=249 /DNA_ORIENTATION=+
MNACVDGAVDGAPSYTAAVHIGYNHRQLRDLVPAYDDVVAPALGAQWAVLAHFGGGAARLRACAFARRVLAALA